MSRFEDSVGCVYLELIIIAIVASAAAADDDAAAAAVAATAGAVASGCIQRSEHKLAQDEAKDGERDGCRDVHDRDLLLRGERRRSVYVRVLRSRRRGRRGRGQRGQLPAHLLSLHLQAQQRFLQDQILVAQIGGGLLE